MDMQQTADRLPLYLIRISADETGRYEVLFMQQQMPVAGLAPDLPASDLPDALRGLADSLPEVDPDDDIPLFPSVLFVINVHREDDGELSCELVVAGPEDTLGKQIPIPGVLAPLIRDFAEQVETKIGSVG